jgi:hypothetical protein
MIIPNILAFDFDGVRRDGMQEYFEVSRWSYMRVWPDETVPGEDLDCLRCRQSNSVVPM